MKFMHGSIENAGGVENRRGQARRRSRIHLFSFFSSNISKDVAPPVTGVIRITTRDRPQGRRQDEEEEEGRRIDQPLAVMLITHRSFGSRAPLDCERC